MSKKSFRVYFVVHEDGRRTGTLMRTWDKLFDTPPPSAYGVTTEDVYEELEAKLEQRRLVGEDDVARYLWDEHFDTQTVPVVIHPLSSIEKRPVIGKKEIPLVLSYAYCRLEGGGFRVMVPRFGGWFVVEELSLAADVLRHAVSSWLLGEKPRWVYELRRVGEEYVTEWSPGLLAKLSRDTQKAQAPEELPAELGKVADLLTLRAAKGKLAPVVGEVPAFAALKALTQRAVPASILLVGPSGAGKSALVRRLAMFFAAEPRVAGARRRRIWSTSEQRVVAGMVYLGMWQERCVTLAGELDDEGDLLHFDTLSGLLAPQPDGACIADFFEQKVESAELAIVAECTEEELARARRIRPSFVARFQVVRVEEPSQVDMVPLCAAYAKKKGCVAHPAAWKRLVRHAAALERGVAFPGKALRFIDWLAGEGLEAERKTTRTLYPRDVSEAYSRFSGVPLELLSDDVASSAEDLARGGGERSAEALADGVLEQRRRAFEDQGAVLDAERTDLFRSQPQPHRGVILGRAHALKNLRPRRLDLHAGALLRRPGYILGRGGCRGKGGRRLLAEGIGAGGHVGWPRWECLGGERKKMLPDG